MLDATVTILDDEFPVLSFKTTEFNPAEELSDGEFNIEVELSRITSQIVTFDIALGGGTATKNIDYENPTSLKGMIEIGARSTIITVPISSDTLNEGNETFNLTLENLSGAVFAIDNTILVQAITIIDDEMPTLSFIGEPFNQAESGTDVEITVELSGPTDSEVSFIYEIIDTTTTTGNDYTVPEDLSGMIQVGSTKNSLTIPIIDDADNEGNETFIVRLKDLNGAEFATGNTLDTSVTITDDEDPTLLIKTTDFNPSEAVSGGEFEIEVELTGATDETVVFDITLSNGTAFKDL